MTAVRYGSLYTYRFEPDCYNIAMPIMHLLCVPVLCRPKEIRRVRSENAKT